LYREDKDPYALDRHADDCDGYLFNSDGSLIDVDTLAERECEACIWEWEVIDRITEETGDAEYYHAALEALRDFDYFERVRYTSPISEMDVMVYLNACMVQSEIGKRRKQLELQREAKAERQARSA
jgi:hypothetical protein